MACFTLTKDTVALLAQCIQVGYEGAPDGVCMDESEYEALEALMAELDACATGVEITVMPIEESSDETPMGDLVGDLEETLDDIFNVTRPGLTGRIAVSGA